MGASTGRQAHRIWETLNTKREEDRCSGLKVSDRASESARRVACYFPVPHWRCSRTCLFSRPESFMGRRQSSLDQAAAHQRTPEVLGFRRVIQRGDAEGTR